MTIWGNHSATQYPDLFNCEVNGESVAHTINDQQWLENDFIPTVQQRGAAIIKARGASSAASAANAAIDHMRDWTLGTPDGDWVSMAIPSDGSYGIPEGIISSFPVTCKDGDYEIVQGLEMTISVAVELTLQQMNCLRTRNSCQLRTYLKPTLREARECFYQSFNSPDKRSNP
ncbi:MAG: hypothetical protein CM15mP49_21380 [Actinomycetota bacterium]|nr:MAG: hypothetical protein CM15mP49_21380 [Actinomycetota bacterium]